MLYLCQQSVPCTDILTAIGTVGAVIVAIFMPLFQRLYSKPNLSFGLNYSHPDCNMTTGKYMDNPIDAFFLRFYVENIGRTTAKDIEVTVDKIEKKNEDKWQLCTDFLPSNLVWTNIGVPILNNLLPKAKRNVDLAFIFHPLFTQCGKDETEMIVTIATNPFDNFNVLCHGEYKFSVVVGGSNCDPIKENFFLSFTEKWETESLMFKSIKFSIL